MEAMSDLSTFIERLTDKEKKELDIDFVSESDLTIRGKWKTIELMKYPNGDVEFEMTDGREQIIHIFDKRQVDFLLKWLAHSR